MHAHREYRAAATAVLVGTLASVAFGACGRTDKTQPSDPDVGIPEETQTSAAALGNAVATPLVQALGGRLKTAIDEGGPVHAIEFCSIEALPLTAAVADSAGYRVRRTSSRLRNPSNAPDLLEREALDYFQSRLAAGEALPAHLVQREGPDAYRFYRPLVIDAFCLQCHGASEELAPGVADALAARYPDDMATGYQVGELRGLIRVTLPGTAVDEKAAETARDAEAAEPARNRS